MAGSFQFSNTDISLEEERARRSISPSDLDFSQISLGEDTLQFSRTGPDASLNAGSSDYRSEEPIAGPSGLSSRRAVSPQTLNAELNLLKRKFPRRKFKMQPDDPDEFSLQPRDPDEYDEQPDDPDEYDEQPDDPDDIALLYKRRRESEVSLGQSAEASEDASLAENTLRTGHVSLENSAPSSAAASLQASPSDDLSLADEAEFDENVSMAGTVQDMDIEEPFDFITRRDFPSTIKWIRESKTTKAYLLADEITAETKAILAATRTF